jgi:hypothetical protein
MQTTSLKYRIVWMVAVVLVFGCLSWTNGDPMGNAGIWMIVLLLLEWPEVVSGKRRFAGIKDRAQRHPCPMYVAGSSR